MSNHIWNERIIDGGDDEIEKRSDEALLKNAIMAEVCIWY